MHAQPAGPGARGREAGDAHRVVERVERIVAEHDIESGDGPALRSVDGEPGRVADDVEAGMGGVPLRGESAAEQPVHLHSTVEFLAEVLTTGVGDAYAEGELEHDVGAGLMNGPDGGRGVPVLAVWTEVVEEVLIEQGGDFGPVAQFACLPGVERNRCGVPGQVQSLRVPRDQILGRYGPAAFRPGGLRGQHGPVDGHPVQREGAVQLG